jgi:hypothetical protein
VSYNLIHPRSMFIELSDASYDGFTESGIELHRRDFTLSGTWKNIARVIMAHETCRDVKMNDLIVFRKHAPKRLGALQGELLHLFEYQVLGVVRKGDGSVWFAT